MLLAATFEVPWTRLVNVDYNIELTSKLLNYNGEDGLLNCCLHSERRGGIATAPPLRRSYSDRAVTSPGGAFQTYTNLANHRHRTRLLADCQ